MTERKRKDVLDNSDIEIVQLSPHEWKKLRDLKLKSLNEEPVAFENPAEAIQKYNNRSEQEWKTILSGGMSGDRSGETVMFFAKDGDECVGMVSSIIPEAETGQLRVATIQHMYVTKNNREKGIGKRLITALLDNLQSKDDVAKAQLDVVVTQSPAIGLYQSVGFQITGTSEGAIDWTEDPLDEFNMELSF